MLRPTLSVIVLGGLVLVPLSACSTASETAVEAEVEPIATADTTSPSPSQSEDEADPCDLLAADAAEALAGEPMTQSAQADVGGLPACQMSGETRGIQVAQVSATVWAKTVPGIVKEIQSVSGLGEENEARIDEMTARLEAGEYDALEACEFFSTMAEFTGVGPGQTRTVTYLPDGEAPQGISAQSCVDGTYTSVLLVGPDIVVSNDAATAMAETLDLVEKS